MKKVKLLKCERQARDFLADSDFRKLTNCLNKSLYQEYRDYVIIMLLMDSGMRLGECSCLLMSDINIPSRSIYLRAEITKGRKDRTVFFSLKTETILRRWINYKDRFLAKYPEGSLASIVQSKCLKLNIQTQGYGSLNRRRVP